jgi:hypothetical protein
MSQYIFVGYSVKSTVGNKEVIGKLHVCKVVTTCFSRSPRNLKSIRIKFLAFETPKNQQILSLKTQVSEHCWDLR